MSCSMYRVRWAERRPASASGTEKNAQGRAVFGREKMPFQASFLYLWGLLSVLCRCRREERDQEEKSKTSCETLPRPPMKSGFSGRTRARREYSAVISRYLEAKSGGCRRSGLATERGPSKGDFRCSFRQKDGSRCNEERGMERIRCISYVSLHIPFKNHSPTDLPLPLHPLQTSADLLPN